MNPPDSPRWYVLRDLKRKNAKAPAYKVLPELGFETFTPMHWVLRRNPQGGKLRDYEPFIHGLLFVRSLRAPLDEIIKTTDTLQYRYIKGASRTPMIVPADEMDRFIKAVGPSQECIYYTPEEITPDMMGRKVKIIGGNLDGTEGSLLTRRGSKKKRIILQLKDILIASVEIDSGLLQFL